MGKSFVYNTGTSEDLITTNELHLNFGVFIDGTLNNMYNTDYRTQHARGGLENPNWKLTNSQIERIDAEKYDEVKNKDRIEELLKIENRDRYQQKELEDYPEADVYLVASHREWLDKQGTDNSFSNDYSNVARMWTCCKEKYKIYVEGMGSSKLDKDDDDGFAFGAGSKSGIRARVREGCEKLAEKIGKEKTKKENETKKLTQITLDVFGFSRGAASARNFVAEVNNNNKGVYAATKVGEVAYNESLGKALNKSPIPKSRAVQDSGGFTGIDTRQLDFKVDAIKKTTTVMLYQDRDGKPVESAYIINGRMPKFGHLGISLLKKEIVQHPEDLNEIRLIVRFLGIYDTVSSYGEIGEMGGDDAMKKGVIHLADSYFTNDEEELNLQNMGKVQQIVHFTAKDEHRENFALTRVDKKYATKNHDGSDRLIEKNFPGVHCDIGGAYMNEPETIDEIETTAFLIPTNIRTQSQELTHIRQSLIDNYWFTEQQIQIAKTVWHYPVKVIELFSRISSRFRITFLANQLAYEALTSNRDMRKEYSFIPLHFMEDYFRPFINEDFMPDSVLDIYSISSLPVLVQAKAYLKKHVLQDNREWEFASDAEVLAIKKMKDTGLYEQNKTAKDNTAVTQPKLDYEKDQAYAKAHQRAVDEERKEYLENRAMVREQGKYTAPDDQTQRPPVYAWEKDSKEPAKAEPKPEVEPEIDFEAQALLRILRNQYFHWSSNRDWLGMDQASSNIRVEYPKK